MKILVIDDDAAFRFSLQRILLRGGYEVVVASDGEQGLELLHQEHPELVICDLIMPHLNGIDTIVEIRRSAPATKIIAISGGSHSMNAEGLADALAKGANEIIVKPFDMEALLSSVRTTIEG